MRVGSKMLGIAVAGAVICYGLGEATAAYWTGWISEEAPNNQTWCTNWNEAAQGMGASGSYSDNIRLWCATLPAGVTLDSSTDKWTEWFSEEDSDLWVIQEGDPWGGHAGNERKCTAWGPGMPVTAAVMSGIACSGRYCDNISLDCDVPRNTSTWALAHFSSCAWTTTWFSEEQGTCQLNGSTFFVGVRCNSSYCDNMEFFYCTLSPT